VHHVFSVFTGEAGAARCVLCGCVDDCVSASETMHVFAVGMMSVLKQKLQPCYSTKDAGQLRDCFHRYAQEAVTFTLCGDDSLHASPIHSLKLLQMPLDVHSSSTAFAAMISSISAFSV
jgi:hypothetical protein